ncbi:MAG: DUF3159 domain-containing protein [Bifidobacteriaceae bacterium]|jgi:hypothetical protein|nr:DUF3159 domain-containing protein [Bifidobacteriaceae bacterium]
MAAPNSRSGLRSVVAEEFSFSEAMGGVRGMVESVLPGLTFVVVYVIEPKLWPPLVAAFGLALVLAVARLIGRSSVMGAVSSLGGIALGVMWALVSGKAEGFFVPGLWINGGYMVGCLLTILVRWPAVAVVAAMATGRLETFREDRDFLRRGAWATWLMVALFAARLAVQVPLYFSGQVALLGTFKLAMGAPPFVALLWLSWLIMRPALRLDQGGAGGAGEAGGGRGPEGDLGQDRRPDRSPDCGADRGADHNPGRGLDEGREDGQGGREGDPEAT